MSEQQNRQRQDVALFRYGQITEIVRLTSDAQTAQCATDSSELHARGDSNLYVLRQGQRIILRVEHRAEAAIDDLELELVIPGPALRIRDDRQPTTQPSRLNIP